MKVGTVARKSIENENFLRCSFLSSFFLFFIYLTISFFIYPSLPWMKDWSGSLLRKIVVWWFNDGLDNLDLVKDLDA